MCSTFEQTQIILILDQTNKTNSVIHIINVILPRYDQHIPDSCNCTNQQINNSSIHYISLELMQDIVNKINNIKLINLPIQPNIINNHFDKNVVINPQPLPTE